MVEERGKGVWIGLIAVILAAAVFLILWILRGGELDAAAKDLRAARDEAASSVQRLEGDVRKARGDADAAGRKAAELEGRLRDEPRRTADAVQQAERRMQFAVDAADARLREAETELETLRAEAAKFAEEGEIRADLERRLADAATREKRLGERLDEAEKTIAELETRAAEAGAGREALEKKLAAANEDLQKFLSAAKETTESDGLKAEIARMETALAGAENANAALEELRNKLSVSLEREKAAAKTREAELRKEIESLRTTAEEAVEAARQRQTDAERREDADRKLVEMEEEWQGKLFSKEEEWQGRVRELEAALAAAKGRSAAKDAVEKLRSEENLSPEEREAYRDLADELEKRGFFPEPPAAGTADGATATAESAPAGETAANLFPQPEAAESRSDPAPESETPSSGYYFIADPAGSSSSIVEKLNDGSTYLIKGGSEEGVRPGMRFVAHRREGEMNRYVGMMQVAQTMDHYSTARAVAAPPPVKICPVTGRAVLEPGAEFSPFARTGDDAPIPLVALEFFDSSEHIPEIGDFLDNPFLPDGRRAVFALGPDLARNSAALRIIEAAGGAPCVGDASSPADFLVVRNDTAAPEDAGTPRRVTLEYVGLFAGSGR